MTNRAVVTCGNKCHEQVKVAKGADEAGPRPGADHPIDVLVREHAVILGLLDELEALVGALEQAPGDRAGATDVERLGWVARHLVAAEPHHRREEEVLFPELEVRGLFGPPQAMAFEHQELRRLKKNLAELADRAASSELEALRLGLRATALPLVLALRAHIGKENEILYPMALQVIDDDETWTRLRLEGDSIGYCCFTPGVESPA